MDKLKRLRSRDQTKNQGNIFLENRFCNPAVGKIFVKFYYQIPAKKAKFHLAGRTYNKRTVITSFYPEEQFDYKDYLING